MKMPETPMKASTTSTPEQLARAPAPGGHEEGEGRIGPNAVLQLIEALRARGHAATPNGTHAAALNLQRHAHFRLQCSCTSSMSN